MDLRHMIISGFHLSHQIKVLSEGSLPFSRNKCDLHPLFVPASHRANY